LTVKELGEATVNVAELALVMTGGAMRFSVKLAASGMSIADPDRQLLASEATAEKPPRLST